MPTLESVSVIPQAKTVLELAWSKFVDPTCRHQNEGKEATAFITTGERIITMNAFEAGFAAHNRRSTTHASRRVAAPAPPDP